KDCMRDRGGTVREYREWQLWDGRNVMARSKERDELEQHITQLKASLNKPGLSADARVTELAALVHARAMTLAADALDTADRDVISPLVSALLGFAEQAEMLSVRLAQLPD